MFTRANKFNLKTDSYKIEPNVALLCSIFYESVFRIFNLTFGNWIRQVLVKNPKCLLIVVTLDSKLTENTKLISEIFSQWRDSLSKDSFTDLKILCKDDWYSGISLHKAVLASISPFMVRVHHMFSRILQLRIYEKKITKFSFH